MRPYIHQSGEIFSFDHMFKISLENPKILQQWVVAMQERFQGGNFENQDLYNFLDQLDSQKLNSLNCLRNNTEGKNFIMMLMRKAHENIESINGHNFENMLRIFLTYHRDFSNTKFIDTLIRKVIELDGYIYFEYINNLIASLDDSYLEGNKELIMNLLGITDKNARSDDDYIPYDSFD